MKIALVVIALLILLAIVWPLLHLLIGVALVAGAIIVVMAAWKILFGSGIARQGQGPGGPPALR